MNATAPSKPHVYRRWADRPARRRWAWPAIMMAGIRLVNKEKRTRGLLWTSLGFAGGSCGLFYALAQLEMVAGSSEAAGLYEFIRIALGVDLEGVSRLPEYRETLWRATFLFLLKVELFWAFIVAVFIGPGLIADDLKTRALPIYFARPVTPLTYLFGKWTVIGVYVGLTVLASNLLGLFFGVLVTGGLQTFPQTARLGSDLLLCGIGVTVFAGVLMLALSSMSLDKRYVTVGWLAVCVLPEITQSILFEALPRQATRGWLGSISLYGDITTLVEWKLGVREALQAMPLPQEALREALGRGGDPVYPACVLLAVGAASFWFCYRRVLRFSRSAASV